MAFRSSGTTTNGANATSANLNLGAGIQAWDCLLGICAIDSATLTVTPPPGWFSFGAATSIAAPDGQAMGLIGRVATGNESGTNPTVSWNTSADSVQIIGAWSGRDPNKFYNAVAVATTNTTANASPISVSVTGDTATTGDDVAVFIALDNSSGGSSQYSFSGITSYTNQATGNNTTFTTVNFQYRDNVASGAFGPLATTATLTSGSGGAGYIGLVMRLPALSLPLISTQPANQQALLYLTATFTVASISSSGALTYQWQDDRSGSFANVIDGSGGTTVSYTTPSLPASANGRHYRVIVTDSNGSTTSQSALLTVISPTPADGSAYERPRQGGLTWDLTTAEWW